MLTPLALLFTAILAVLTQVRAPLEISQPLRIAPGPELSAPSAFLIDTRTGEIFLNKNADQKMPIASITKLMTALTVFDAQPNWSRRVVFEKRDQRQGDIARVFPGEEITILDAWNVMLVASSNDAAALLARVSAGSEEKFVRKMNENAQALGFKNLQFTDPTGLDPENSGTAREVAALTRLALGIPAIRTALTRNEFTFTPRDKTARMVRSTNQLLAGFRAAHVTAFGGKTGHIEESGYHLAFAAGKGVQELMGVVLGSKDNDARFQDMSALIQWGFENAK